MKQLLLIILTLFCQNMINAQSHVIKPDVNCKFNKVKYGTEAAICPACANINKKEKEAIAAEDKRRTDVLEAKAKAEKEARDKAWQDKLAEDKKKAESGKVYIGNSTNVTNQVTESKKELESMKQNYFHVLSLNHQDDGNPYSLNRYFETNQSNGFIINSDTLFRNQFRKCIGIRNPSQLWVSRTYNEFNFPPNLGIVILNEEKSISYTNSYGTHSKMYPIADLIDINGKRILNDPNITAILHFVDDYFILFKGMYSAYGTYNIDYSFDDAVIFNYKTKATYPIHHESNWNKVYTTGYVNKAAEGYRADMSPVFGTWKAFISVKRGINLGSILYYVTIDGRIEETNIAY